MLTDISSLTFLINELYVHLHLPNNVVYCRGSNFLPIEGSC